MKNIVVAGIGTGVGKTFISASLTEALEADYWKPVQAGNLDFTDTDMVKSLISNSRSVLHPEVYRLKAAMSPHAAAKLENINIELDKLAVPSTGNRVIIELAGGLMVPLNDNLLNIDLLQKWNLPVILVSQNYLGSINHTLLSIEILRSCEIELLGIIFNGEFQYATEKFIIRYSRVTHIGRFVQLKKINKLAVRRYATILRAKLNNLIQ